MDDKEFIAAYNKLERKQKDNVFKLMIALQLKDEEGVRNIFEEAGLDYDKLCKQEAKE